MENGSLSEFSSTNATTGTLAASTTRAASGKWSAHARYNGGGRNGYERGLFYVGWKAGDSVWYRASYYLPTGFKNAMQGQVALLRWDDFNAHPTQAAHGGVVISGKDKRAHLATEILNRTPQTMIGSAFDLPEGRWFTLEVHQVLGSGSSAVNEVYLDGRKVLSANAANLPSGRSPDRLRAGIVAIASGAQMNPLDLYFDNVTISRSSATAGTTTAATTTDTTGTTTGGTTGGTTGATAPTPPATKHGHKKSAKASSSKIRHHRRAGRHHRRHRHHHHHAVAKQTHRFSFGLRLR